MSARPARPSTTTSAVPPPRRTWPAGVTAAASTTSRRRTWRGRHGTRSRPPPRPRRRPDQAGGEDRLVAGAGGAAPAGSGCGTRPARARLPPGRDAPTWPGHGPRYGVAADWDADGSARSSRRPTISWPASAGWRNAAPGTRACDVPARFKVGDDRLHGALRDATVQRDLPESCTRLTGDGRQHPSMVGEKDPLQVSVSGCHTRRHASRSAIMRDRFRVILDV